MKLLKLTEKAYEKYRQQVRGNSEISFDQAMRKLNRNVILVKETASDRIKRHFLSATYSYGNLDIKVRFGTIIDIQNHKGKENHDADWVFPKRLYISLSKKLKIQDSKFNKMSYGKKK